MNSIFVFLFSKCEKASALTLRPCLFTAVLGLIFMATGSAVYAQNPPVSTGMFSNTAIGGTDTVAYHEPANKKARRSEWGDDDFKVTYLGANWLFASKESADKFAANPQKYIPHYNGFCANALSIGEGLVRTNGEVFEFFGDELYLFYSEGGRKRWVAGDWKTLKSQADAAWLKHSSK